jgi:CRP-like cAMP-binding protein
VRTRIVPILEAAGNDMPKAWRLHRAGLPSLDGALSSLERVDDPEIAAIATRLARPERESGYPLPAVDIVEQLTRMPTFAFASVDELFRIAQAARQIVLRPGQRPYRQGDPIRQVLLLIEGRVSIARDRSAQHVTAPAALTLSEVLEDRHIHHTITVMEPAVCLALDVDQFLTMLSDNMALVQGLFTAVLAADGRRPPPVYPGRDGAEPMAAGRDVLQAVDKVVALEQSPLIAEGNLDDLLALAGIATEAPLRPGVLFAERDAAAVYTVVTGEIRLEREGCQPIEARAGATIGMYETLAHATIGWRATVTAEGLALRIEQDALFDVLADRVGMLRNLFRGLTGILGMPDATPHAGLPLPAEACDPVFVPAEAIGDRVS